MIQIDTLARIARRPPSDNLRSLILGLERRGATAGLDLPHRLAHYLAQLMHESAGGRYDREVWGPSAAQARYDTRTDLGNTAARDGDGYRFRGRGPIQITGAANYRAFTKWAQEHDPRAPDFVAKPDAVNTDPWEGLGPIWYWETRRINRYADEGDAEMVTRTINGGLNGFADRLRYYDRAALVLLGHDPEAIRPFQSAAGLVVDGISGPRTRAALHASLRSLPPLSDSPAPGTPDFADKADAFLAADNTIAQVRAQLDDYYAQKGA